MGPWEIEIDEKVRGATGGDPGAAMEGGPARGAQETRAAAAAGRPSGGCAPPHAAAAAAAAAPPPPAAAAAAAAAPRAKAKGPRRSAMQHQSHGAPQAPEAQQLVLNEAELMRQRGELEDG